MSDADWKVGDLALCVDDQPRKYGPVEIRVGNAYNITRVRIPAPRAPLALYLAGVPDSLAPLADGSARGFCSSRFRKIRPDEHEACEEEFRILLNLSKNRVSA